MAGLESEPANFMELVKGRVGQRHAGERSHSTSPVLCNLPFEREQCEARLRVGLRHSIRPNVGKAQESKGLFWCGHGGAE